MPLCLICNAFCLVAATNKCGDLEGSMQYNVDYRPSDPRHSKSHSHVQFFILMAHYAVISNGKKQEVDLRINKAYNEQAKDKDHIYESIH